MGLFEDFFRAIGREIADAVGGIKDHLLYDSLGIVYSEDPADDVQYRNEHVRRRLRLRELPKPALDIDDSGSFPCVRGTKDPGPETLLEQFDAAATAVGWTTEDISAFHEDNSDGWTSAQEMVHPFKVAARDVMSVRRFTSPGLDCPEEEAQLRRERAWRRLVDREDFQREAAEQQERDFEAWREAKARRSNSE